MDTAPRVEHATDLRALVPTGTEGEEALRALLEALPVGVVVTDVRGRIVHVSPRAASLGARARARPGEHVRRAIERIVAEVPAPPSGTRSEGEDLVLEDPTGGCVVLHVDVRGLVGEGGRRQGALYVITDVTRSTHGEAIATRVRWARRAFSGRVVHELRDPLATLSAATHLLRTCAPPTDRSRDLAEVVLRSVDHLARLLDGLVAADR